MSARVGVLALQGDFAAHAAALERAGAAPAAVRDAPGLERVDALVLPGGESTAISTLLDARLAGAIRARTRGGMPALGTCAGAVLMARASHGARGPGLGLLDTGVRRNAYGRQGESFVAPVATACGPPLEGVFIRAPAFVGIGPGVRVLGRLHGSRQPVWIRAGARMACTFHPELAGRARPPRAGRRAPNPLAGGDPIVSRRVPMLQVDVFTDVPLEGNPLAVFPDARALAEPELQAVAREMNLSETTFVLPADTPGADYRVRIFTPGSELPFAGHPTVGTAHALLATGRVEHAGAHFTLRQQTLAGVQAIDVERGAAGCAYTMTQPPPSFAKAPSTERLCAALRVKEHDLLAPPQTVAVGVAWHVVALRSLDLVRGLDPDMSALADLERDTGIAVTVFCHEAEDPACSVRVRSFAPASGIPEDPVCGSGNGCVAAYLARSGLARPPFEYRAEQGGEVGRPGRLKVRVDSAADTYRVQVGGRAVTVLEGELVLPSPNRRPRAL